jgi:alpha-galactosidase
MINLARVVTCAVILSAGISVAVANEVTVQELAVKDAPAGAVWLDGFDLGSVETGWGKVGAGKSAAGKPITVGKKAFVHGIGVHAPSVAGIDLGKAASRFVAVVGVDDETGVGGSVVFQVWVDRVKKADSGLMKGGDAPKLISVDLTGAEKMALVVTDGRNGNDSDHADWAGAALYTQRNSVKFEPGLFTIPNVMPKISSIDQSKTAINGPRIVGTTPGRPFVFLVPATGEELRDYTAKKLPAGLVIDPDTGIISGSVVKPGSYEVMLSVAGRSGVATRKLVIEAGEHKLARTPPMGWNSWNCWAGAIDDAKVRAAADAMVASGLAAHGYQYINIDDCWQKGRDANGEIVPNAKFPDMKALADYVHSKGLRLGIYSSPGPQTCAGFEGSYRHEEQDAKTYATWGMDYLKHDWCSYGSVVTAKVYQLEDYAKPFRIMGEALDACGRDIVYSLCQYGMGNVWEWGADVGGNCWRTTYDITDMWESMSRIGFGQNGHEKYAGPGRWNDPDMLVVGRVGWGPNLHPTRLKYVEQVTHLTLWSLLSAPLLIGCDMTTMDKFTLDLLTNDEVLDVNQDPLGKPAGRVAENNGIQVWSRPLQDGAVAVGIFNTGMEDLDGIVKWSDIGVQGKQTVRDLWLKQDLGVFDGQYAVKVPAHGAFMFKIGAPRRD